MAATEWKRRQNTPATRHNVHDVAPPFCDCVQVAVLVSGAQTRIEIPAGATHVMMASTVDFAMRAGDADVDAAWPSDDIPDGSGCELSPTGLRKISEGETHIACIASAAIDAPGADIGRVTFAFFAIKNP